MICSNAIATQRRAASLRRLLRRDDGSALVEMGVGMLVFMAFFFGLIQFCYGLYAYNYVGEAAREATRFAMVRGSQCMTNLTSLSWCSPYSANLSNPTGADRNDIQNFVQNLGFAGMSKTNVSVTTNWYSGSLNTPRTWSQCTGTSFMCNHPGNAVQVTVTYPVAVGIPFVGQFNIPVKSTSQMIIVQ